MLAFLSAHLHVRIAERAAKSTRVSSTEGRVELSGDNKNAVYMEYEEAGADASHPLQLDLDVLSPREQAPEPLGLTQSMMDFRPLFHISSFFA